MSQQLDPSRILEVGLGFRQAKTLLTAVKFELFTKLGEKSMTGEEIASTLALHPRGIWDFLDGLVALKFLERDGDGKDGRYRNTEETAAFLDKDSPRYMGGILEMANDRMFGFWGDLEEALRTGKPQNEIKHTGKSIFEELYGDPVKLEQFMGAMAGISTRHFRAFVESFDFSKYETLCDVGGATARLSIMVANRHPHIRCTSFDLPVIEPIAKRAIEAAGMADRVATASGDFFADPIPRADLITMSMVLHDWNLEKKMHLIKAAYDALPDGGAFVAIEHVIDDARRENVNGLMMSLTMLLEFGDAFDFTGAEFTCWCKEMGFKEVQVLPLTGPVSAAIAYK